MNTLNLRGQSCGEQVKGLVVFPKGILPEMDTLGIKLKNSSLVLDGRYGFTYVKQSKLLHHYNDRIRKPWSGLTVDSRQA